MPIPLDALMALKALQIGTAAAASQSRSVALAILDAAVAYLQQFQDRQSRARLAFYLAARAELLRPTAESIRDRMALKVLCEETGSSLYQWYMRLKDSTEARSGIRSEGSTSPYAKGGGSERSPDNKFLSPLGRLYRAMDAVKLDRSEISDSDKRFLERATIKDLLDKHGIPFSA